MNEGDRENCEAAERKLRENVKDAEERLRIGKEQLEKFQGAMRAVEDQSKECEDKEGDLHYFSSLIELEKRQFVRDVISIREELTDYVLQVVGVDMIAQGTATDPRLVAANRFEEQISDYHKEISELYRISHRGSHSKRMELNSYAQDRGGRFQKAHDRLADSLNDFEERISKLKADMRESVWGQLFERLQRMAKQVHENGSLDSAENQE